MSASFTHLLTDPLAHSLVYPLSARLATARTPVVQVGRKEVALVMMVLLLLMMMMMMLLLMMMMVVAVIIVTVHA